MEITPHLSEVELAEFLADPSRGLGTHLAHCDSCLYQVARMRETIAELRGVSDKPYEFWSQQQAAIRTRIASIPSQPAFGLSSLRFSSLKWAGAASVAILAGLLFSGGNPPPSAPVAGVDPGVDQDHELLIAVEHVMQSGGPEALEPAAYLVREINQTAQTHPHSRIRNKETRNEN
jgi:hypothetical protein